MLLFLFFLSCIVQQLHYYCAFGKREALKRFVIEDGAKPAIFGSYSYDPVLQVFIPPPPGNNTGPDNHSNLDIQGSTRHDSFRSLQLRTMLPPQVAKITVKPNLRSNYTNRSVPPSVQRLLNPKNVTSKSDKSNKV